MKFKKVELATLPCCYATEKIEIDGRSHYVFATDDYGPCYSFDAVTGERQTVWEGPGGTMSIVPLPGRNGDFLASQKFLPVFAARESEIVSVTNVNGQWMIEPWMKLPYVHRFDILERNGSYYFLGCILSSTEKPTVEWNEAGYHVAARLNDSFEPPRELNKIAIGMHHNHGYWRFRRNGYDCALTACDEGVFEVIPPADSRDEWQVNKIFDTPASDAVYCDIDGDGVDELAVIEAFHGTDFVVYRKKDGHFEEIYRYPEKMDFVHAIWGGELNGEPVFIGGYRRLAQDLFVLRWRNGTVEAEIIENGGGPSNVTVDRHESGDRLLVANRESAQAVYFEVD